MNLLVKKASSLTIEEKTALGINGIPENWPIESYPYVDNIPAGFELMSDSDVALLKTNNQAAYDAWLVSIKVETVQSSVQTVMLDTPTDSDRAQIVRVKLNTYGWHFQERCLQLTTSQANSLVNKDCYGMQKTDAVIRFYNVNNTEIFDQTDIDNSCVKTILELEPTYDYEVISATIYASEKSISPLYVGVVLAPDIPEALGGNKTVLCGANLGQKATYQIEGRAVKKLIYNNVYHSNKIRTILTHDVGYKLTVNFDVDHFKP